MNIGFRVSTHTEDRSDMKNVVVELRLVRKRSSLDSDQYISFTMPRDDALRDFPIGSLVGFDRAEWEGNSDDDLIPAVNEEGVR